MYVCGFECGVATQRKKRVRVLFFFLHFNVVWNYIIANVSSLIKKKEEIDYIGIILISFIIISFFLCLRITVYIVKFKNLEHLSLDFMALVFHIKNKTLCTCKKCWKWWYVIFRMDIVLHSLSFIYTTSIQLLLSFNRICMGFSIKKDMWNDHVDIKIHTFFEITNKNLIKILMIHRTEECKKEMSLVYSEPSKLVEIYGVNIHFGGKFTHYRTYRTYCEQVKHWILCAPGEACEKLSSPKLLKFVRKRRRVNNKQVRDAHSLHPCVIFTHKRKDVNYDKITFFHYFFLLNIASPMSQI